MYSALRQGFFAQHLAITFRQQLPVVAPCDRAGLVRKVRVAFLLRIAPPFAGINSASPFVFEE